MNNKQKIIWEDENLTELNSNYANKNDCETADIIRSTNYESAKNECKDTGKNLSRNCPACNSGITYNSSRSYKNAMVKNTICLRCHNIRQRKYSNDFIKKCPICNIEMNYTSIRNRNVSIKLNKICASCAQLGSKNHMYGKKWSNEHRIKMNEIFHLPHIYSKFHKKMPSTTGERNPAKRPDVRLKISESLKFNCYSKGKFGINHPAYGSKRTDESKIKMRISAIRRINNQKFNGTGMSPSYNMKACKYINTLNDTMGWNLQHAENGGEYFICDLGYWVDGYDKEKNIVVEYDEPFQNRPCIKDKDTKRMILITKKLQCRFFRYNEMKNELKEYMINKITGKCELVNDGDLRI